MPKFNECQFEVVELFGKTVLLEGGRLDRSTLPDGLFCYDIRTADDTGELISLEKYVLINHGGCVVSNVELDNPVNIAEEINFLGEHIKPDEVEEFFKDKNV